MFNSCDFLKGKSEKVNSNEVVVAEKPAVSKLKNGIKKYYFDTGELKSIVEYKDNKKVGVSTTYYKSGEKQYDIPYVDGMKHGLVNWYYKNGKVYRETSYAKGKKNGYQKKFWDKGTLKSELLYKNDLPAIGLKEINNQGKEKSTPFIKVEKIDLIKSQKEYVLKFRLSNARKKVQFYQGKLIDGQFFPADGRGFQAMQTVAGVGELRISVPKGFTIEKDIHIVAVEKTSYQNDRILSIKVPVSFRNSN
ncbi:hypothetical protein BZG02_10275 [Labilibaculum filiforme]|uniref:Toxin-antitoxin system YwqK family antitoxin n=1 Tax=Labilibaculum filiforme TaxID=1940526 RepID=A0A2N3HYK3_9BACT|nr:hypothetical protein BZG02_10275 [Labilibaculum filiforme]